MALLEEYFVLSICMPGLKIVYLFASSYIQVRYKLAFRIGSDEDAKLFLSS
jgi:hypothetical protein